MTILTKGRAQGNTGSVPAAEDEKERDLFLNPGFIYSRREANERAAMEVTSKASKVVKYERAAVEVVYTAPSVCGLELVVYEAFS